MPPTLSPGGVSNRYASLLDQLEVEIRAHPSPCTWAQIDSAIKRLEEVPTSTGRNKDRRPWPFPLLASADQPCALLIVGQAQPKSALEPRLRETVVQLALLRKLPLPGGRRGAKAAPIPASGLYRPDGIRSNDRTFATL